MAFSARQLDRMATMFATLADPARLRILHSLRGGARNVGSIHEACGLKQANTSKHLRVLRESGLVAPRRAGTTVRYEIAEPLVLALCDLVCNQPEKRAATKKPAHEK